MNMLELWPEIEWIQDNDLREKVTKVWEAALERSVLTAEDLNTIPFTLLCGPDLKVTFMDHKRSVVHIAKLPVRSAMNSIMRAADRYGCPDCRSYPCGCRQVA